MTGQLQTSETAPARAERGKAAAAVIVTVLLWASAFVAIRGIGETLSPAPMALIRIAVAAASLTILVLVRYRGSAPVPRNRRTLTLIAVYAVLWLAGYTVVLNAAERHIDAGTAALLVNIAPLLIAFGAGLFLGEGYPKALVAGSVVALGGLSIIALGSSGERDWLGVVLCVLAAVLYAAGVLIQKAALRGGVDGTIAIWLGCLIATAALLPWTPQLIAELQAAPVGAILASVYLGLFPTAIGFTTWAYALHRMPAGRLSTASYAVPVVSILLSWLLLAEIPTVYGLIGGAICLVGVAIARRSGN
ncbi:DMT family transporter [Saccharopolyspora shandongensis]|uniref:Permease of the drug/metabolite transporter (DMT) superfamily n=1 Tax=Saccharopolyspora shandongensis TaxID=418495 RepID=A0A1H3SE35_9PSEU|nr:DMT family transporter [Saccharopolyspora shandongensis]SDZ36333.1 Permease of the drug/metabolite transporter (DMT) superfamily [Saccharopolyspora shandongensis]